MTQTVGPARDAEAHLASYRERVWSEVERHLPKGEPARWLYEPLADYPRRSGKGLRAALCLASSAAHGGAEDDALASAAAIELLHNAFLVHDDIEDGSLWRRGEPTLHRREGMPLALNAGDALAVLSFEVMRSNAPRLGRRVSGLVIEEFSTAVWRTLEGQALELGWRRDGVTDLTPRDYLELVLLKSCWYTTIAPLRIGALIGSMGNVDLGSVTRFGFLLGAAFQITDDLLNLTGSQTLYGKEICGDLREGKRSLIVIHALAAAEPADRTAVVAMLQGGDDDRADDDLEWLADLLARSGSISFARDFARGVGEAAAEAFVEAFGTLPRPDATEVVAQLVDYVLDRTR